MRAGGVVAVVVVFVFIPICEIGVIVLLSTSEDSREEGKRGDRYSALGTIACYKAS